MKRIIITMMAILTMTISASAMSYEQARREALFLTDKMAYELNLNDRQYDAAYEINLDYLMGVTSVDDVYGAYWTRRNLDLSYILLEWQWNAFCAASYFYRPLYWRSGYWHFGIYARYPRRDYFYFGHPTVYVSYSGGHSWRHNGGHSYYKPRRDHFHGGTTNHVGMRDHWNNGGVHRNNGNGFNSSTRVTVNNGNNGNNTNNAAHKSHGFGTSKTAGTFGASRNTPVRANRTTTTSTTTTTTTSSRTAGSFGTNRNTSTVRSTTGTTMRSASPSSASSRSFGTATRSTSANRTVRPSGSNSSKTSGSFGARR